MKQLVLGKEGLAFLQSFLNDGNYLGAELSAVLCGTGEVLTWLPDELDLADVSFRDGWKASQTGLGLMVSLIMCRISFVTEAGIGYMTLRHG
jgi:hypothetical protein